MMLARSPVHMPQLSARMFTKATCHAVTCCCNAALLRNCAPADLSPSNAHKWRHNVNGRLEVEIKGTWHGARQLSAQAIAFVPTSVLSSATPGKSQDTSIQVMVWNVDVQSIRLQTGMNPFQVVRAHCSCTVVSLWCIVPIQAASAARCGANIVVSHWPHRAGAIGDGC